MPVVLKSGHSDTLNTRCASCKVRPYSFCRCLKEEELRFFAGISTEKRFTDKEMIFLQADEGERLYNITEGNVKVFQLLHDGRIQIIGFLYPGDFFGIYKKGKYNYSAQAIGDINVCEFKEGVLDQHMKENGKLSRELLNMTTNELILAQDRIKVLGKLTATERMASFINNISKQRARIQWQDNPISLPMSRQDIADYLGLTIATVSREITNLKTSLVIKMMSTNQIYIKDKAKLAELAN